MFQSRVYLDETYERVITVIKKANREHAYRLLLSELCELAEVPALMFDSAGGDSEVLRGLALGAGRIRKKPYSTLDMPKFGHRRCRGRFTGYLERL
jgi:hypothetical protein